jgi:DNA-binding transcriptional ArsR family regulator
MRSRAALSLGGTTFMSELHLHFRSEDLARTRLAANADRTWETALSLNLLQSLPAPPAGALGAWCSWARSRLGAWARPLLVSAPAAEDFPAFLALLHRDENDPRSAILSRYHATVIAPVWPTISMAVATDHGRRARRLLTGGLEELFGAGDPVLRWQAPVLTADHPIERHLDLAGRGLVLVPSYFARRRPVVQTDPTGPTVLVHPIAADARIPLTTEAAEGASSRYLDALLGATRAAVLKALAEGCTTTELARRVGVSAASASQHATVLREAGLISTERQGGAVRHVVTALGSAVLDPRTGSGHPSRT